MNFEELSLDPRIMKAVTEMGFEQASPIQAKSIPIAMEGKDMIGQAKLVLVRQRRSASLCCRG